MATPVLFRADKSGTWKGSVTAVFPTLPGSPGFMTCYAHIGQHGSCGADWLRSTRPATPAEFQDLQRELVGQGYADLRIVQRISPAMRAECRAAARA